MENINSKKVKSIDKLMERKKRVEDGLTNKQEDLKETVI
jgi:hypothetical protein